MSENFKQLDGQEGLDKIAELISDIRIAMLSTASPDGSIDSRPMATQKASEFDGTLWFLTAKHSEKVREIEDDSRVSVLYADPSKSKYVTIKGRAFVNQDKAKIHELWNPMYQAWFPKGEEDPEISVLRVHVMEADYWEASSSKLVMGMKYLAAAATGGKVDVGESGKVQVSVA